MPDDGSWGLNELQFLAKQAANGNLINVTGSATTAVAAVSYTPATGKTFTLFRAQASFYGIAVGTSNTQLRNNGTVQDAIRFLVNSTAGVGAIPYIFATKGDQLIGNSVKTYDVFILDINGTNNQVNGTIEGYIA